THTLKTLNGKEVKLTSTEFSLLLVFLHSSNNVLSRDQLLDHISGSKWSPMDRSIDVLISRLRKKIELNSEKPMYIKTIRGVGYKFTSIVRS
ncbi:MAG: DNA-binding response OmpR family regulator, partial [Cyclobacteriaceae bacterium]